MANRLQAAMVPDDPVSVLDAATLVAEAAFAQAAAGDCDGAVPSRDIAALADAGLLHAPLPAAFGGQGLGSAPGTAMALRDVLRVIGGGALSLGRLYEGHVNAVLLVTHYGTAPQVQTLRAEADAGRLSAVWNAQGGDGLQLVDGRLLGGKIHCSGAGMVRRPLLTATGPDGVVMLLPDVTAARIDLAVWTPLGMRASLTGSADFTGIGVAPGDIVGSPGDYYRAPLFSGGAWRVLAVQLGALERLLALYRAEMAQRGRGEDPVQRARFGAAVAEVETARLWTARAARIVEDPQLTADEIDAFVNLARHSFERAALALIGHLQRGIGLGTMLRPSPIERIIRDLTTYLRQPFLDASLDAAARWALAERPLHFDIGRH